MTVTKRIARGSSASADLVLSSLLIAEEVNGGADMEYQNCSLAESLFTEQRSLQLIVVNVTVLFE